MSPRRYRWHLFAEHPQTIQKLLLRHGDDAENAARAARQWARRHGVTVQTCQMGPWLVMFWRGTPRYTPDPVYRQNPLRTG